jgi:hypothetical protein
MEADPIDWAGTAHAWGVPNRAEPNVMSVTATTDAILNIGDSL